MTESAYSAVTFSSGNRGAVYRKVDPAEPPYNGYEREYVIVLSDWSDKDPEDIYARLKKMSHFYNTLERIKGDLWSEIQRDGLSQTWNDREMWNEMRITLANDTIMNQPMHLHGVWSDLETGDDGFIPRKHMVIVQPGSKISYRVTADAPGAWAYHCHLLCHMPGMFRKAMIS